MSFSVLSHVLNMFFNKYKFNKDNYSERCSVHVHANVQNLTPEQLATVCLLYQVFEGIFFNIAGEGRRQNIFCVPWSETSLARTNIQTLVEKGDIGAIRRWQKYAALNLLPIFTQGTIEFRHLEGTADVERILNWCCLIGCLFEWARNRPLLDTKMMLLELNTNSQYELVLDKVFGIWAKHVRSGDYKYLLEEGVLNMKYSLFPTAESPSRPSLRDRAQLFQAGINERNSRFDEYETTAELQRGDIRREFNPTPPTQWFASADVQYPEPEEVR
jgi:hypothetical protein